MPFLEAPATARGCRVLCNKYGMTFERRLLSVVGRHRRRKPSSNKIRRVLEYCAHPFETKILELFRSQCKVAAKSRAFERSEYVVKISQVGGETTVPK